MRYRKLGRTGLIVSEMCLGTNMFGGSDDAFWQSYGGLDQSAVNAVVACAVEGGISVFDTADGYTKGESEQKLGQAFRDLGLDRSSHYICTKGGTQSGIGPNGCGGSRAHLIDACNKSLTRLGVDYIDLYLLHWFDVATPLEETLRAMDDLVRAGKVRYIGCSNFQAWEVMKALGISERERLERFAVVQASWSIATREVEREVLPMAQSEGVGIMAFSTLLGGVLTGKYQRDGSSAQPGRHGGRVSAPLDHDRVHDIVDAMRRISQAHGVTAGEIALAFLLRNPALSTLIVGATRAEQLTANLRAAEIALSDEEYQILKNLSALPIEYGASRTAPSRTMRAQYL